MNLQELKEHAKKTAQQARILQGHLKISEAKGILRLYNQNIKALSHETVVEEVTKKILEQKTVMDNMLNPEQ